MLGILNLKMDHPAERIIFSKKQIARLVYIVTVKLISRNNR